MPIDDLNGVAPTATVGPSTRVIPPAAPQPGLNQVEQAALEEIMGRATDAEVVCIIRPRDAGGKSEVITLDRVSPEFVRALAERAKAVPDTIVR